MEVLPVTGIVRLWDFQDRKMSVAQTDRVVWRLSAICIAASDDIISGQAVGERSMMDKKMARNIILKLLKK